MWLFIVTGLFGLLFFIGSLIFGGHDVEHDHDAGHDHDGPSVFSVFNVAWFLIGFGGMGSLLRSNDVGMSISTISGVTTGIMCGGIAFFVMRLLSKQQGDSTLTSVRIINATGTVILAIPENGVGKIQCNVAGSSQEFLARATVATRLPEGSRVRIVGDTSGICLVEAV